MDELPEVSAGEVAGITCYIGSPTFQFAQHATKAYQMKNPGWPGAPHVAVIQATAPLQEGMPIEQACILGCMASLGAKLNKRCVVVQTMVIKNGAERVPLCFATILQEGPKTEVLMSEDEIPYTA